MKKYKAYIEWDELNGFSGSRPTKIDGVKIEFLANDKTQAEKILCWLTDRSFSKYWSNLDETKEVR